MAGILGTIALRGRRPSPDTATLDDMARALGPRAGDSAGSWRSENTLFAHRSSPSIDGDPHALSEDGRYSLVCDGDAPARELVDAFARSGPASFADLQGAFALALVDTVRQRLHLARDPLGVRPLYWWADDGELTFASSPLALLAHPKVSPLPDLPMVSAYLTTLRTAMGRRTMFDGIFALEPGEVVEVDLGADRIELDCSSPWRSPPVEEWGDLDQAAERVRATLGDALGLHLERRAPAGVLLDRHGPILTTLAEGWGRTLPSYPRGPELDAQRFDDGWRDLIEIGGLPLSTPDEVSLVSQARLLVEDGLEVALCSEGAEEIFAGYEGTLRAAAEHGRSAPEHLSPGRLHLEIGAWVAPAVKGEVLCDEVWGALNEDAFLDDCYERGFARCQEEAGDLACPLDSHLRFLRRTNLAGLLQRLDAATALAGVRSVAPFADRAVVELAETLPAHLKFDGQQTRLVLRRAFEDLPDAGIETPPGTPPPPTETLEEHLARLDHLGPELAASPFAQAMFRPRILSIVAENPAAHWTYAWPMVNLARWGDHWWS